MSWKIAATICFISPFLLLSFCFIAYETAGILAAIRKGAAVGDKNGQTSETVLEDGISDICAMRPTARPWAAATVQRTPRRLSSYLKNRLRKTGHLDGLSRDLRPKALEERPGLCRGLWPVRRTSFSAKRSLPRARWCLKAPASWGLKALSRSALAAPIVAGAPRIG